MCVVVNVVCMCVVVVVCSCYCLCVMSFVNVTICVKNSHIPRDFRVI